MPDVELSYFDNEGNMQKISSRDLCSGKKARCGAARVIQG